MLVVRSLRREQRGDTVHRADEQAAVCLPAGDWSPPTLSAKRKSTLHSCSGSWSGSNTVHSMTKPRDVLATVLSEPVIQKSFRQMAIDHIIQLALPRTVSDIAEVQWVKVSAQAPFDLLEDVMRDADIRQEYAAQARENASGFAEALAPLDDV
jgi:hypothetical protein